MKKLIFYFININYILIFDKSIQYSINYNLEYNISSSKILSKQSQSNILIKIIKIMISSNSFFISLIKKKFDELKEYKNKD